LKMTSLYYGRSYTFTHASTKRHLHSHPFNYPSGSTQQQVTGYGGLDVNDNWVICPPHNSNQPAGSVVSNGDTIRLEHVNTGHSRLHSHAGIASPVTNQQEATTWRGNGDAGDANDLWKIELVTAAPLFEGSQIRLIHVATNGALHSHPNTLPAWGHGQGEVTVYSGRDSNDIWIPNAFHLPSSPPSVHYREWNDSMCIGATQNYGKLRIGSDGSGVLKLKTVNSDMIEGAPRLLHVDILTPAGATLGSYQTLVE